MDFNSTVKGSALEGFYPAGWDFDKIDACIDAPEKITERQEFWNEKFNPIKCCFHSSCRSYGYVQVGCIFH